MFTYQSVAHFVSVDQMHCILFMRLYSCHHFILYFGSSLYPWLNTRIMGTSEQHFPFLSLLRALRIPRAVSHKSMVCVAPFLSLWEKSCNLWFSYKLSRDRGQKWDKSCLGHHYLFISSAHNYRSSSCSICKLDANRSMLPLFFFLLIFFFSLMIPSKIDSFLPRGAWKTSLHFARDPAGCCKVVLKESKPIACDLSRITRSSHHFEPGKLTYGLS